MSLAMGKKQQSQKAELPTPGELRLLQVLWRIREGAIEDIVLASGEDPPPNYKTVQAWLRIMERKGQVDHRQEGRAFVFRPLISRGDLHRLSIRNLVARYFTGSRSELLVALLSDERISREELSELEGLIRNRRKELS
jgi:predicted transcriptional regulator